MIILGIILFCIGVLFIAKSILEDQRDVDFDE